MKRLLKPCLLIMLFAILPLYMRQGYYELGEAKGLFFMIVGGILALLLVIFDYKLFLDFWAEQSNICYSVIVLCFSAVSSLLLSIVKDTSFFGLRGWRTGFITFFICFVLFVEFRGERNIGGKTIAFLLVVPFIEFILGIIMRFGIYPIKFYGLDNAFLATIGNINWYTAYLSIFVPIGIGLGFISGRFTKGFVLSGIYTFFGLLALILQGSKSAALVILAAYLLLFLISLDSWDGLDTYLCQLFILGLTMEVAAMLILLFGKRYTYEYNIIVNACLWHIGAVIMGVCFFFYRICRFLEVVHVTWRGKLIRRIWLTIFTVVLIILWLLFVRKYVYDFGNGRGFIWSITIDMFNKMTPFRRFFGIGQDAFSTYAYSDPEIADSLMNIFGYNMLTNAHSDLLTILIEKGIFGVLTYVGFIAAGTIELIKNRKEHAALVCILPVFACYVNSIVSFSLVVSTPYLFVLMGIGCTKKSKSMRDVPLLEPEKKIGKNIPASAKGKQE